jgi:hypothetical protein
MSDTIIVKRTGQAPLRVRGEVIVEKETSPNNASPHYEGTGVWSVTRIIKTGSGKYVASVAHYTQWQGSHDSYEAGVFPDAKSAVNWLQSRIPHFALEDIIDRLGADTVAEEVE